MEKKTLRTAAYILPYRDTKVGREIALMKYSNGFGFIGGRCHTDETPKESLSREVEEELGIPLSSFHELADVDTIYTFETTEGARSDDPDEHEEQHHFYLAEVDSSMMLQSIEADAEVVWMPIERLEDPSVVVFSELRNYLAASILPLLQQP